MSIFVSRAIFSIRNAGAITLYIACRPCRVKPHSASITITSRLVKRFHDMADAPSSLADLDRGAMEETRLARQAAKRPATSHTAEERPSKVTKINEPVRPSARAKPAEIGLEPHTRPISPPTFASARLGVENTKLHYPNGAVKKTWAYGFGTERRDDEIKIHEVLNKHDLKMAIISSFCWDWDWLATKFDIKTTVFVFVVQARDANEVSCPSFLASMRTG